MNISLINLKPKFITFKIKTLAITDINLLTKTITINNVNQISDFRSFQDSIIDINKSLINPITLINKI